jgi:hypothetical protein
MLSPLPNKSLRRVVIYLQPPLVTHIELSVDWPNKKAAQQALQRVAATFTQLEKLEISAE